MQPDVRHARIAVDELGLDLEVEFIHDITKALQYEVLQMPALIIDEKGRILRPRPVGGRNQGNIEKVSITN